MGRYCKTTKCPWCGNLLPHIIEETGTAELPASATCGKCGYDYTAMIDVASGLVVEPLQIKPGLGERLYKSEEQTLGPPEGVTPEYIASVCQQIRDGVDEEWQHAVADLDYEERLREAAELDSEEE
jgi:hypothetical protein